MNLLEVLILLLVGALFGSAAGYWWGVVIEREASETALREFYRKAAREGREQ